MKGESTYEYIHYNVAPPLFVVGFTLLTQILAVFGTIRDDVTWSLVGNSYSWKIVGLMLIWAYLSLKVPSKEFNGPTTRAGCTPSYRANGLQYFFFSFSTFVLFLYFFPQVASDITQNFPQVIATCNIIAFILCLYLLYKGKISPEVKEDIEKRPTIYEFYRGMEVHPRLLGVDVKQFIICRFGMMAWLFLDLIFFFDSCRTNGFNLPSFVCLALQTIYLGKFFWWETGYFDTLDIIYDRAGYYLCWGCLVWVPCFYTFSSYFISSRIPVVQNNGAWLILMFGVLSIMLNYLVDWEKEYFRANGGRCRLWGKKASCIVATYKTNSGATKKSYLLTSGTWGMARHMNYLFEIMLAFSWSLPGLGYGIWPFLYPLFLTSLLVHRIFRDEKKCHEKYGKYWEEYCEKVPYRMVPWLF